MDVLHDLSVRSAFRGLRLAWRFLVFLKIGMGDCLLGDTMVGDIAAL